MKIKAIFETELQKDKRDKRTKVNFVCRESEWSALQSYAKEKEVSASDVLRRLIRIVTR